MQFTHLVIIDPQNDFCDPNGSLYVQGAEQDMERLANLINSDRGDRIQRISVTLDSHQVLDIAHPLFWKDSSGKHPDPLVTIITHNDVKNNVWVPTRPQYLKYALEYTEKLEQNGRYPLIVWPVHCAIGSWGHNVYPILFNAIQNWCERHCTTVQYVSKGSHPLTEHYSAVKADVPIPSDPSTNINAPFIQALESADNVLVAGEASSHCVLYTVRDIADEFGDDNISKLVMLTDAMSPVQAPGMDFPKIANDFVKDMVTKGLRTDTTTDWAN